MKRKEFDKVMENVPTYFAVFTLSDAEKRRNVSWLPDDAGLTFVGFGGDGFLSITNSSNYGIPVSSVKFIGYQKGKYTCNGVEQAIILEGEVRVVVSRGNSRGLEG